MQEEYISLNEYSKRYKMSHTQVKKLISEGKVDYFLTQGGYYKIKITDKNLVSREEYNRMLERAIRAETKLANIEKILI